MKSLFKIIFFAIIVLQSSCNDSDDTHVDVDVEIDLQVSNAAGNNLLDAATTDHYVSDDIKVYRLINGERRTAQRKAEVYRGQDNGEYGLKVYADEGIGLLPRWSTMLVQWRKDDLNNVDTLHVLIDKVGRDGGGYSIYATKVFNNTDLAWDLSTHGLYVPWKGSSYLRLVEITK